MGKTTLLHILLGLAPGKTKGEIAFQLNSKQILPHEARKLGHVGILTQTAPLVPWMTIHENLVLPSRLNKRLTQPTSTELQRIVSTIGLQPSVFEAYPHQLSRGMAQRVSFARTLAYKPSFLLLDEMFTGLDSASRSLLTDAVRNYSNNHSVTCLVITHDVEQALVLADEIFYLTPIRTILQLSSDEDRRTLHDRMVTDLSPTELAATPIHEGATR